MAHSNLACLGLAPRALMLKPERQCLLRDASAPSAPASVPVELARRIDRRVNARALFVFLLVSTCCVLTMHTLTDDVTTAAPLRKALAVLLTVPGCTFVAATIFPDIDATSSGTYARLLHALVTVHAMAFCRVCIGQGDPLRLAARRARADAVSSEPLANVPRGSGRQRRDAACAQQLAARRMRRRAELSSWGRLVQLRRRLWRQPARDLGRVHPGGAQEHRPTQRRAGGARRVHTPPGQRHRPAIAASDRQRAERPQSRAAAARNVIHLHDHLHDHLM
eukprot:4686223-Prymnesium_polylepis.1